MRAHSFFHIHSLSLVTFLHLPLSHPISCLPHPHVSISLSVLQSVHQQGLAGRPKLESPFSHAGPWAMTFSSSFPSTVRHQKCLLLRCPTHYTNCALVPFQRLTWQMGKTRSLCLQGFHLVANMWGSQKRVTAKPPKWWSVKSSIILPLARNVWCHAKNLK